MGEAHRKYRLGGYRAGQRPDDAKIHTAGRFQANQLPPRVDLRKYMTEVEEQVGNSCVANAFVGAYEYLAKRDLGDASDVSRLFVYYNARAQENAQNQDDGTQMYCAINALIEHGACSEELWPNDESLLYDEPSAEAYEHAANYTITESEWLATELELWRHTLAEGYPIAFALNTFESFDEATRNRGRVPLPKPSDNVRETHGWHAMLCVGYSDKDRMFIVRNSWGSAWGDRGYCYIPYDYVMHSDHNGHDSWIVRSLSDLDFSVAVWEDEESFFSGEDSLLLYDFYIGTQDPEGFVEKLDALCQEYVNSEEDYYFDYDYEENDAGIATVNILNFNIIVEDTDDFLSVLDELCQEYAVDEDYDFNTDGEESDSEDAEESEGEYEEDEEEEANNSANLEEGEDSGDESDEEDEEEYDEEYEESEYEEIEEEYEDGDVEEEDEDEYEEDEDS